MNPKMIIGAVIVVAVLGISIIGLRLMGKDSSDDSTTPAEPTEVTIGILAPAEAAAALLKPALAEIGYVQDENTNYVTALIPSVNEYESAAQTLIDSDADVIVAIGVPAAAVTHQITKDIPIVFMGNQSQFVTDIEPLIHENADHTNLTGVITANPAKKRLELMVTISPEIDTIYTPYNYTDPLSVETMELLTQAAADYNITLIPYKFTDIESSKEALAAVPEEADAVLIGTEIAILSSISEWVDMSIQRQIPLVISIGQFHGVEFPPGVLMGYGGGIQELYQQVADLVNQILQGTAPADLPIRPSDVYMTVSLGAAEALNIEIPLIVLDQASQIIREPIVLAATTPEAATAACRATITTPLGNNQVCITQPCDQIQDAGFITYQNKMGVASCTTDGAMGICARASSEIYFYESTVESMSLEMGCANNGGMWQPIAAPSLGQ